MLGNDESGENQEGEEVFTNIYVEAYVGFQNSRYVFLSSQFDREISFLKNNTNKFMDVYNT